MASNTGRLTVLVSTTMNPHSGGRSLLRGPMMRDRGAVRGQRAALMGTTLGYGAVFFARTLKLRVDASTLTILALGNLRHHAHQKERGRGAKATEVPRCSADLQAASLQTMHVASDEDQGSRRASERGLFARLARSEIP